MFEVHHTHNDDNAFRDRVVTYRTRDEAIAAAEGFKGGVGTKHVEVKDKDSGEVVWPAPEKKPEPPKPVATSAAAAPSPPPASPTVRPAEPPKAPEPAKPAPPAD